MAARIELARFLDRPSDAEKNTEMMPLRRWNQFAGGEVNLELAIAEAGLRDEILGHGAPIVLVLFPALSRVGRFSHRGFARVP